MNGCREAMRNGAGLRAEQTGANPPMINGTTANGEKMGRPLREDPANREEIERECQSKGNARRIEYFFRG